MFAKDSSEAPCTEAQVYVFKQMHMANNSPGLGRLVMSDVGFTLLERMSELFCKHAGSSA